MLVNYSAIQVLVNYSAIQVLVNYSAIKVHWCNPSACKLQCNPGACKLQCNPGACELQCTQGALVQSKCLSITVQGAIQVLVNYSAIQVLVNYSAIQVLVNYSAIQVLVNNSVIPSKNYKYKTISWHFINPSRTYISDFINAIEDLKSLYNTKNTPTDVLAVAEFLDEEQLSPVERRRSAEEDDEVTDADDPHERTLEHVLPGATTLAFLTTCKSFDRRLCWIFNHSAIWLYSFHFNIILVCLSCIRVENEIIQHQYP